LKTFEDYADDKRAFRPDVARYVNSLNVTWVASETAAGIFRNLTHGAAKKLMGTRKSAKKAHKFSGIYKTALAALPDSFDARTQWPKCVTIQQIRDQSACGSCWAFGAAESMSDRYCTYFGQNDTSYRNISITATDLMSCCWRCGFGCEGGYPEMAWSYWSDEGITTNDCDPYPLPPCEHHVKPNHYPACPSATYPTPACPTTCQDGTPFSQAKRYFGADYWSLEGESEFKQELYNHGPFEITMDVYQDFESYKSGVYKYETGPYLGGHAIKLVGWGSLNGVPYWTVANSWNQDWGESGYFLILRGANECGIEEGGVAGSPYKQ